MKKADSDFFRSIGICPRCRKNQLFGDEKSCPECKAKQYAYDNAYKMIHGEKIKEQSRIRFAKMYAERKEKGLCVKCGKRDADKGYVTCKRCRTLESRKALMKHREKYGMPMQTEWVESGKCFRCGKKAMKGKKLCVGCYEELMERFRKGKENAKLRRTQV